MSNLDFMGRIAEGKIQEAIEEGKFDNLPGRGKPIVFDDDPLTPPHLRLVNRILRNANVLPEWMQLQKDLEADRHNLADMKRRFIRENERWRLRISNDTRSPGVERQYCEWHRKSRSDYLRLLKGLNGAILKLTLVAPSTAKPLRSYRIGDEMASFDQDVPPHLSYSGAHDADSSPTGRIREEARMKYQARPAHDQSSHE